MSAPVTRGGEVSRITATSSFASDNWQTSIVAAFATFGVYFCMYGFRKPFTAASYPGLPFPGVGYKSALITTQVVGYLLSKILGVRVISEMRAEWRIPTLLSLVGAAQLSLLLLAVTPAPWNVAFIFFNGLSLGMVFGLVLGTVEGRKQTEALIAGLCASFILADGASKSAGSYLLQAGIAEIWMPFTAGLVFLPPFLIFTWLLKTIPPPSATDVEMRRARVPMMRSDRQRLFRKHAPGLIAIIGCYALLTILRSLRADFAPEIWQGLGLPGEPAIYTWSEILVVVGVLAVNGFSMLIRDNRRAFFTAMGVAFSGFAIAAIGLRGWQSGLMGAFTLMVMLGLGLYLPYVAVHTTIFERLIAMTGERANIGFLMYLADSCGYLGYVIIMLLRDSWRAEGDFPSFFLSLAEYVVIGSAIMMAAGWVFFIRTTGNIEKGVENG